MTVPAWACLASSRNPGALGLYGFRNRRPRSHDLFFVTSRDVRVPRLWDILGARGRPSIVVGVPPTYPPSPLEGVMVGCFLAPGLVTWPPEVAAELDGYAVDVPDYRRADRAGLLAGLHALVEHRFDAVEHLAATRPWDLLFVVEIATDRLHHRFWDSEDALLALYRRLDRRIGRLLAQAGEDTAVLVASDHGAQRLEGGVYLNEWLRREGYLVLREEPSGPTPLSPALVDWRRTRAWGEGGHYGRVFLTRPDELLRKELKARLEALGEGTIAHRPEDLYPEQNGVPPDLLVYFAGLRRRSLGEVGTGAVFGPASDEAGHAHEGLYVVVGDGVPAGGGADADLLDVAPTVLSLLGEPVPEWMEGRSLARR